MMLLTPHCQWHPAVTSMVTSDSDSESESSFPSSASSASGTVALWHWHCPFASGSPIKKKEAFTVF
jgi:hypothetical protein